MFKVGYRFIVEGEYCADLLGLPDPNDEAWQPFGMSELHPDRRDFITVMVANYDAPCEEAKKEAIERAVHVIEWMRGEKGWQGFDAALWLDAGAGLYSDAAMTTPATPDGVVGGWADRAGKAPERVFRWELC